MLKEYSVYVVYVEGLNRVRDLEMNIKTKVIIIGAGASGISAGCHLIKNNLNELIILEAKNRIGGRIFTTEFGDNVVDLGAQWVHGEKGNVVYKLAQPHGLIESSSKLKNYENHIFATSDGKILPTKESAEIWKLFYLISDQVDKNLKGNEEKFKSYGDYFISEYYKTYEKNKFTSEERAKEILGWMERFDDSIQGSDTWFDVSTRGILEYWSCEGDSLLNWKNNGYRMILKLLMDDIKKKLSVNIEDKIKLSQQVKNINYTDPNKIIVTTTDGNNYTASNVIVTTSLGVLKNKHNSLFNPLLPPIKQQTIEGLNFGSVNKIFIEFPYRWWPENSVGFGLIWRDQDKKNFLSMNKGSEWLTDVFEFLTVDYQPRVLCGWIIGPSSRYIEKLSDKNIEDNLYKLLNKFFGNTYDIPRPINILRSQWTTDEHVMGCYSYRSLKSEQLNATASKLAEPIVGKNGNPIIMFAGEATHEHYFSTVHGAIESGEREAKRLINYYRQINSRL
ncbi:spermine oxidase isoform X1 [Microplitis demolitor]|uniref:spermine oxidase isoform X1 n=2 Tax=Microplitis demolitor TaxID=69319 RepID=UPI0004CD344C|nr:spermine oxidase isoform X1 [Microplitis demolitor]